jgi:hypothetical protein
MISRDSSVLIQFYANTCRDYKQNRSSVFDYFFNHFPLQSDRFQPPKIDGAPLVPSPIYGPGEGFCSIQNFVVLLGIVE